MNHYRKSPALKLLFMLAGLVTFVVGISVASTFSIGFGSKYVTLALVLLAVGFFVYRFRKGGCCS